MKIDSFNGVKQKIQIDFYLVQTGEDVLTIADIFGESIVAASSQPYPEAMLFEFLNNIDVQALAEAFADFDSSERLSLIHVKLIESICDSSVKELDSTNKGLNALLQSYQEQIDRLKEEMNSCED